MFRNYFNDYVIYSPPVSFNRIPQLPKVAKNKDEVNAYALHWASHYLLSKNFPQQLISILVKELITNLSLEYISDLFSTASISDQDHIVNDNEKSLKSSNFYIGQEFKQLVIDNVDKICIKYKEEYNEDYFAQLAKELSENETFHEISYASIKNVRRVQEDRFSVLPHLNFIFDLPSPLNIFGVYDGHNGPEASSYASTFFPINLINRLKTNEDLESSLISAFHKTDENFIKKSEEFKNASGSTCAILIMQKTKVTLAWVGDSQIGLVSQNSECQQLVDPHKADRADEIERIRNLGGEILVVDGFHRVQGCLAITRSFGDNKFKKYISSTPSLLTLNLNGNENYFLIGTDGLWDFISIQESAQLIHQYLLENNSEEGLSAYLANSAKKQGSTDNTTVIVIFLKSVKEIIENLKK